MLKVIRHYYWLVAAFIRKNVRFLVMSFVLGFFAIIFFLQLFPFLQSFVFRQRVVIGFAGQYTRQTIPRDILSLISNPLVSLDADGQIIPVLAQSWEVLDKGTVYRFHLKSELYWSDNKPFTGEDISYDFKDVDVKILDNQVMEFRLKQPLAIFPNYLTKPVVKKSLAGVGGVYKVQTIKFNKNYIKSINLAPNKAGLPYKVYRFYKNEDELITAYKKGDISEFTTSKKGVSELFAKWNNTTVTESNDFSQIMTLFLNNDNDLLSQKDVRRAIVHSMPSFEDYGQPALGPIPPNSWAYSPDVRQYSYNIDKAQSLLKSSLEGRESPTLTLFSFFDHAPVAEEIKRNLEQAGLTVDLKLLSYVPQDFDMLLTAWNPPADPDQYFFWHSTQKQTNITNYKNVKVDKLLEDGRRITSTKQRKAIYKDFQETIVDEVPAVFLYYPKVYTIKRK